MNQYEYAQTAGGLSMTGCDASINPMVPSIIDDLRIVHASLEQQIVALETRLQPVLRAAMGDAYCMTGDQPPQSEKSEIRTLHDLLRGQVDRLAQLRDRLEV